MKVNVKKFLLSSLFLALAAAAPCQERKMARELFPGIPETWDMKVLPLELKSGGRIYVAIPPGTNSSALVMIAFWNRDGEPYIMPSGNLSESDDLKVLLYTRGRLDKDRFDAADDDLYCALTFINESPHLVGQYSPGSRLIVAPGTVINGWTAAPTGATIISWEGDRPTLSAGSMSSSDGKTIQAKDPAMQIVNASTKAETKTKQLALKKYSDGLNKISFEYPADWQLMSPDEAQSAMGANNVSKYLKALLYDPSDRTQNINIQLMATPGQDLTEAAYAAFLKGLEGQLGEQLPGYCPISSRIGTENGMAFLEIVYDATRSDGVSIRQKQLRTGKSLREVVITFSARADSYVAFDKKCFVPLARSLKVE